MRAQILKLSSQSKHTSAGEGPRLTEKDTAKVLETFDRRMRRVATERAALAQNQLLEMLDKEERELKRKARRKEQKVKRNKRTKARRKKKKERVQQMREAHLKERKQTDKPKPCQVSSSLGSLVRPPNKPLILVTKSDGPPLPTQNLDDVVACGKKKAEEKVLKCTISQAKPKTRTSVSAGSSKYKAMNVSTITKHPLSRKTTAVPKRKCNTKRERNIGYTTKFQTPKVTCSLELARPKISTSARSRKPLPTSTPSLKKTSLSKTVVASGGQNPNDHDGSYNLISTIIKPVVPNRAPVIRRKSAIGQHTTTPTSRARPHTIAAPWPTPLQRNDYTKKMCSTSNQDSSSVSRYLSSTKPFHKQQANIPIFDNFNRLPLSSSSTLPSSLGLCQENLQPPVLKIPSTRKMNQATTPPPAQKAFSSTSKSETHSSTGSISEFIEPLNNLNSCYKKHISQTITTLPTSSLWIPPSSSQQPRQETAPVISSQKSDGVFCNRLFSSSIIEGISGLNSTELERAIKKIPSSNPWNSSPASTYHEGYVPEPNYFETYRDPQSFESLNPVLNNTSVLKSEERSYLIGQRPKFGRKNTQFDSGFVNRGSESFANRYHNQEHTLSYVGAHTDTRQTHRHTDHSKNNFVKIRSGRQKENNYVLQGHELSLSSSRVCQRCTYTLPPDARFCCMCGTRVSEGTSATQSQLSN